MIYSLDTNILITPCRGDGRGKGFYHPDFVNQYWEWLVELATNRKVFLSDQVLKEIEKQDDLITIWFKKNKDVLVRSSKKENVQKSLKKVSSTYEKIGALGAFKKDQADPYVIAHAHAENATVVSNENSAPGSKWSNIKIPDVCKELNIRCITGNQLLEELKFSANRK